MDWKHNLVGNEGAQFNSVGTALTLDHSEGHMLWLIDQLRRRTWCMGFSEQGKLGKISIALEEPYDALLPHRNGYVFVRYHPANKEAVLDGYTAAHIPAWHRTLPNADSRHWSLAEGESGILHILYSSCNPHDAYRQAHVVRINPETRDSSLLPFFTGSDDDFPLAQLLVPLPERLAVCVRSYGSSTIFYTIDLEGEILHTGAFAAHPHSKWAMPLCHVPLEGGDVLMGGYKEETPGQRRAWVCRFDADLGALNGRVVAGEHAEQAVTALALEAGGTVLALCPPWKILRLSAKGFLTHMWEVPAAMRVNTLTAILPAPNGGCFITGRSFVHSDAAPPVPAAWLAKIGAEEFTEI